MEAVKHIIVTGTMTDPDAAISPTSIDRDHRRQGRYGIGYHYVIERNGTRYNGRGAFAPGNHTRGFNGDSIGICLIGGGGKAGCLTYTYEQTETLADLLYELQVLHPDAKVVGYGELIFQAQNNPNLNIKDVLIAHPRINKL